MIGRLVRRRRRVLERDEFVATEPPVVYTWPGERPEIIGRYVLEAHRLSPEFPEVVVRFETATELSGE